MSEPIDFVVSWVDGSDAEFLAVKRLYSERGKSGDQDANAACRYRSESEMLRYWFRCVEKFAPWVRKIHFVTCGQKPEWLDETHPKLNLVNHQDYIPKQYLPTFNARTIALNYHRIEGAAEQLVLFDDDVFLMQPLSPDFFFKGGNPVLATDLRYPKYVNCTNWCRAMFNDYCVVNRSFDIRKSIWANREKWFNLKELGFKRVRQNVTCYLANKSLPVGNYGHIATPHLKSTLEEIWERWGDVMDASCMRKFRSDDQVNPWLSCAWSQAKGAFYPAHEEKLGMRIVLSPKTVEWACNLIREQSVPQLCLNDTSFNTDYETSSEMLLSAFSSILPEKSSFEKN